jgi:hypothetical protein
MESPFADSNIAMCRCRHCEEHIEFDAADFAEEFSMVPCPHCGLETRLALPPDLLPPEQATAAQLNHLRRLGLNPPPVLPFEAARLMIQEALGSAKATEKQMELLRAFGTEAPLQLSQTEADQIIMKMLAKPGKWSEAGTALLPRQMQILRFWDRIDLALSTKQEAARWLNDFYDTDPSRRLAWEKFQTEYGHVWQDDPFWVPLGMSESYLKPA